MVNILTGAVITAIFGIIAYFLKRTMSRGDKNEQDIQGLKVNSVSKEDFKELKDDFFELNDKFATKEEVREVKKSLEKITGDIDFIKEKTVRSEDFLRVMTRLENKIDQINEKR